MDAKVLELIYRVCSKKELKEAIAFKEYDEAAEIIADESTIEVPNDNIFTLYDSLSSALESSSSFQVIKILDDYIREFQIGVCIEILDDQTILDNFDMDNETRMELMYAQNTAIKYLQYSFNIPYGYKEKFAKDFISKKDNIYPKREALETVFDMPMSSENVIETVTPFIESLLYGNELSFYELGKALIDDDSDSLMEKVQVIKFLRERYYDLRVTEVENLQKQINSILEFGLKRKKTEE